MYSAISVVSKKRCSVALAVLIAFVFALCIGDRGLAVGSDAVKTESPIGDVYVMGNTVSVTKKLPVYVQIKSSAPDTFAKIKVKVFNKSTGKLIAIGRFTGTAGNTAEVSTKLTTPTIKSLKAGKKIKVKFTAYVGRYKKTGAPATIQYEQ